MSDLGRPNTRILELGWFGCFHGCFLVLPHCLPMRRASRHDIPFSVLNPHVPYLANVEVVASSKCCLSLIEINRWLLEFYTLATSKVISEQILTSNSVQLW